MLRTPAASRLRETRAPACDDDGERLTGEPGYRGLTTGPASPVRRRRPRQLVEARPARGRASMSSMSPGRRCSEPEGVAVGDGGDVEATRRRRRAEGVESVCLPAARYRSTWWAGTFDTTRVHRAGWALAPPSGFGKRFVGTDSTSGKVTDVRCRASPSRHPPRADGLAAVATAAGRRPLARVVAVGRAGARSTPRGGCPASSCSSGVRVENGHRRTRGRSAARRWPGAAAQRAGQHGQHHVVDVGARRVRHRLHPVEGSSRSATVRWPRWARGRRGAGWRAGRQVVPRRSRRPSPHPQRRLGATFTTVGGATSIARRARLQAPGPAATNRVAASPRSPAWAAPGARRHGRRPPRRESWATGPGSRRRRTARWCTPARGTLPTGMPARRPPELPHRVALRSSAARQVGQNVSKCAVGVVLGREWICTWRLQIGRRGSSRRRCRRDGDQAPTQEVETVEAPVDECPSSLSVIGARSG